MTYQVLARKWRPKTFEELVGQQHVIRALQHSIENQKLHHAYLFTGTRGVGKTTIARIFAKSLNCLDGTTITPCSSCAACCAIDEGRYVDLIEVDAASRTRVEDTKEILDNVQYAPTQARYKIYLIDEVHMLSTHSFNALLKTLEEPPAHVIFILATTDPQKIPVTVLSRCLQFYLKPLDVEKISAYLSRVCQGEDVSYETAALDVLARAAAGSLRDSLSLLDQAIAYTSTNLTNQQVLEMLGAVDHDLIYNILSAILNDDAETLMAISNTMILNGVDFSRVLEQFIDILHQISVAQCTIEQTQFSKKIGTFAQQFSKEDIQLFYEICLKGHRDIASIPVASIGFEMTLLRLLTFKLSTPKALDATIDGQIPATLNCKNTAVTAPEVSDEQAKRPTTIKFDEKRVVDSPTILAQQQQSRPLAPCPLSDEEQGIKNNNKQTTRMADNLTEIPAKVVDSIPIESNVKNSALEWPEIVENLALEGMAKTVIMHCNLIEKNSAQVTLGIEKSYQAMLTSTARTTIHTALKQYWGRDFKLAFEVMKNSKVETPAAQKVRQQDEALTEAKTKLLKDECLNEIVERFDATFQEKSIELKDE